MLYTLFMDQLLKSLSEKKRKLDLLKPLPLELVRSLEEWLKVELTYSSNAIEGNTLTRIETAEVIEKGVGAIISGKPLKDQLEAINHANAVEFIKKLSTERKGHQFITEQDILDIHKIVLAGIQDEWAGKYRRTEVFIRGSDAEFPMPNQISQKMKEFIKWLEGQQGEHPVKVAADVHYKFVSIHPFIDGNGRTTRLFMNLILLLNGYPMAIIRNEDRTQYLASFDIARNKNDLQPFSKLVYTAVEGSLDIYLDAAEGKQPNLKEFSLVVTSKGDEKSLLKIGELAKESGETIHTLRFWTKEGLLEVKEHTKSGYQLYSVNAIGKIKYIRRLQQEKRLTIEEIKKL